jgi:hypothetical protein
MSNMRDFMKSESFQSQGEQHSKASIAIFVVTFLYMLFVYDYSPGFIGGALFGFVGLFLTPIIIALPAVMMKLLVVTNLSTNPKLARILSSLLDLAYLVVTALLTRYAYLSLFG